MQPQPYPYPYTQPQYPYPQPYPQPQYPYGYPPPGYPQPGYPPPPLQPKADKISGEHRTDDHLSQYVTFSIGLTGGLGAAILGKPKDQTLNGENVDPAYPGFAGLMGVIGAQLELRILGYVGIEMDLLYASEHGSTEISVTDLNTMQTTAFNISIGHGAFHLPLLLKAAIPGETATPFFFIGPEFVIPEEDASAEIEGTNDTEVVYGAYTEDYTMVAFGLGVEINLPTKGVDMRIPLSIRAGYNPGVGSRNEMTRGGPPFANEEFSTAWEWTIRAQLGTSVNF